MLGNPKFTLSQFSTLANSVSQLVGTSARSPHHSPTLRSPRRTIVLFAQLGRASKSPHTGASARDTPLFTISTLHQVTPCTLARRAGTYGVTQEPVPSRRTNQAPTHRACLSPTGGRPCPHPSPKTKTNG